MKETDTKHHILLSYGDHCSIAPVKDMQKHISKCWNEYKVIIISKHIYKVNFCEKYIIFIKN